MQELKRLKKMSARGSAAMPSLPCDSLSAVNFDKSK
jgi:hypothetical protein